MLIQKNTSRQLLFFIHPRFSPPILYSEPCAVLFPPCISDRHTESISLFYRTNRHIRTMDIREKAILHHRDTATPCHIYRSADKSCRQLYHRAIQTCESNRDRLFCRCILALLQFYLFNYMFCPINNFWRSVQNELLPFVC